LYLLSNIRIFTRKITGRNSLTLDKSVVRIVLWLGYMDDHFLLKFHFNHATYDMKRTKGGLGRKFLPGKLVKGLSQKYPLFLLFLKWWTINLGPNGKLPGIPVGQSTTEKNMDTLMVCCFRRIFVLEIANF
jgi:hypothetical protein